jgi:LPXTG-motif cell wall-anchored protein
VDPSYVTSNPLNVHGSFTMGVVIDLQNQLTVTGQTWQIGGATTNPVTVTSRFCQQNCSWNGSGQGKSGSYDNSTDTITWSVQLPTGGSGFQTASDGLSLAPGQTVTVTDPFAGNDFTVLGAPTVSVAGCLTTDQWGYQAPRYSTLNAGQTQVSSDDTSVTFTTAAGGCTGSEAGTDPTDLVGSVYQVHWKVHANDLGKGVTGPGKYTNTATVTVNGTTSSATGTAQRVTYGGTAVGENFGRFTLKKIFGSTPDVLRPQSVTVDYTITYPGDVPPATSGTITLSAGNGWQYTSPEIFQGSTVEISEENPGPANVNWNFNLTDADGTSLAQGVPGTDDASYSFPVLAQTVSAYTFTNTASVPEQQQNTQKVLDNPDNVNLPDGTSFELDTTWPDNPTLGIKGGSAKAFLPADGAVVNFPNLPIGAVVTFAEATPAPVAGATWTSSAVTPSTLTIGPDSLPVTVTATNTLARNVGTFSIEKELTGDAAALVTDKTFDVHYSYPADASLGIEAGSGTVKVTAGDAPASVTAPAGAVVTLSEQPVKVEGGTWAAPEFTPDSTFTVVQDENVAIGLTNLITLDTGAFSIHKVVNGTAVASLPAGTAFTVHYSYADGTGFAGSEGDLTVKADGTVTSPQLPYGATVTLTETAPEAIPGATWAKPTFSPSTVRIGDGTTIQVTLTNTLDKIPDPALASTGSNTTPWVVLAAAVAAAGLLMLLLMRRRRA